MSLHICLLDQAADVVGQHLDGGAVLAAVGDDDVRIALAGLDEGLVHGLDRGAVLGDDAVQRAAALLDVPQDAAEDALVGVGVHIDLIIEQLAQFRLGQGQNALHDEDGGGFDVLHFAAAVVVGVVVNRAVDGAARLQLPQMLDEQVIIKGIWMVVVQLAALLKGQIVVAFIVTVVGDEAHLVLPETLLEPESQRGLTAARTARNADDQIVHVPKSSRLPISVEKPVKFSYNIRVKPSYCIS